MPEPVGSARDARNCAALRSFNQGRPWQVVTCDNKTYAAIRTDEGFRNFESGEPYRIVATYEHGEEVAT